MLNLAEIMSVVYFYWILTHILIYGTLYVMHKRVITKFGEEVQTNFEKFKESIFLTWVTFSIGMFGYIAAHLYNKFF